MSWEDFDKSNRRLGQTIKLVETDERVCAKDRKQILAFVNMRMASGIGKLRAIRCLQGMRTLCHLLGKPMGKATKDDLIDVVGAIETQGYAENTKYDLKVVLKMYFKWLKDTGDDFPKEVKWLKPRLSKSRKLPEELLTEAEVIRLAKAADHPRDRALVLLIYESGCRIGELLTLRIKNVSFDENGAILRVTGKTGDRRVRIISSAAALATWIDFHQNTQEPDAPLWPSLSNNFKSMVKPVEYASIRDLFIKLGKRAGITKRVYPHLFRHSRATKLAVKLTEAQMKEYFGWARGSDMTSTYVHLSGRDVDDAIMKINGVKRSNSPTEDNGFLSKECPRCKYRNNPSADFCTRCGTSITQKIAFPKEDKRDAAEAMANKIMQDPEFKKLIVSKLESGLANRAV